MNTSRIYNRLNFLEQGKIIVFELDIFQLQRDYSAEELKKLFDLFKELSIYNNLFLLTNNSLQVASNFLKRQGLNLGYLVSNLGACVYNLTTEKKEKEIFLNEEVVELILRFGFFNNLIFVIHCSERSFIFGLHYLSSETQRQYANLLQLSDLKTIQEVIDNNSIYSLEILFEERDPEFKKAKIQNFLQVVLDFQIDIDYLVVDPIIYLFAKGNSKLDTIFDFAELSEDEIKDNLLYSSGATPDFQVASQAFIGCSFAELEEFITKKAPDGSVIYLSKDIQAGVDWGCNYSHLGKEEIYKFDGISRKIKKLELSSSPSHTSCFELDLSSGFLQPKKINKKLNTGELFQKRMFKESSENQITLFFWPEQLKSLLEAVKRIN